jgi:[ribosomal protein S5]-alanine N-acetyltransferase
MDVVRYMVFPLCSRADSQRFLRDCLEEFPPRVRAIVDDGQFAGLCGIVVQPSAEEGELWYLVRPESWGRGIATEAVRLLLQFGFATLDLHRLWATCLPENPPSARVLEKVGMRQEGFLVRNLRIHGEWRSSFLYAILADEWREKASL